MSPMNTLSDYLQETGIRQSDFADQVGVGQAMISRLARGLAGPSLPLALAIARATGGAVPVECWDHPPANGAPTAPGRKGAA